MAQQDSAATRGRFHESGQRIEPRAFARHALFIYFAEPLAGQGKVTRAPEHYRFGRVSIAPGTTRFLIIGLKRFGQSSMDHKAYIGLVYAHTKGDGGDHHHIFRPHKIGLCCCAFFSRAPCVINTNRTTRFGNLCRQFLGCLACRGIDNASTWITRQNIGNLPCR